MKITIIGAGAMAEGLLLPVQYTPHQFWQSFTNFFFHAHIDC